MTFTQAGLLLLSILVVVDLALTTAIIARLRQGNLGTRRADVRPIAGHLIDTASDKSPWPPSAKALTNGRVIVILVSHGCAGCEALRLDLRNYGPLRYPIHAVVDGVEPGAEQFAHDVSNWDGVTSTHRAPHHLEDLTSFDCPTLVPVVALLIDGLVVTSGFQLKDLPSSAFLSGSGRRP